MTPFNTAQPTTEPCTTGSPSRPVWWHSTSWLYKGLKATLILREGSPPFLVQLEATARGGEGSCHTCAVTPAGGGTHKWERPQGGGRGHWVLSAEHLPLLEAASRLPEEEWCRRGLVTRAGPMRALPRFSVRVKGKATEVPEHAVGLGEQLATP